MCCVSFDVRRLLGLDEAEQLELGDFKVTAVSDGIRSLFASGK
jgi:hypothetical protein